LRAEARISLGITVITAAALATALIVIHVALNRFQERHFDVALLDMAGQAAKAAARNSLSLADNLQPVTGDVGFTGKYAVVYSDTGRVLAAQPRDGAEPPLPALEAELGEPFDFVHRKRSLRGVRISLPEPTGGSLLLAASRDDLDSDDEFLDRAMALAFIASMLSLFVCSLLLTKRFTAEHRRVATTLRSVAHGDVYARALQGSSDPDVEQWRLDLNDVAEKLSALILLQRRFIANAAHELRSPIAALYGELQQCLRQERSNAEYKTSVSHSLRAARRLKRLADDLLTLARAEHDASPLEAVRLQDLFDDVAEELGATAREKAVQLVRDVGDVEVRGRPSDLQRLLRNLLDNALRHSPSGSSVRCEAASRDGWLTVRVMDDGPGVDVRERARVFEPFYRSPETRASARDGSGLGLSIAREIARSHGGEIRIQDSVRGAVFAVELPSAAPSADRTGPYPLAPLPHEESSRPVAS
jgi:two-component system heavy metal sensor histidine kinase CusS